MPGTVFDAIWDQHVVEEREGGPSLLHIDLHLVHELTSPQAFARLRERGRSVRRPDLTLATTDHSIETTDRALPADPERRLQVGTLMENCRSLGIRLYDFTSPRQGIVHVIGPELGATQPGKTIVCGDSHTASHGALGALAFGVGTSEVETVLATQCLYRNRPRTLEIRVDGILGPGLTAKDLILAIIGRIGVDGATGHAVEYTGSAVRALTMEGRLTLCNMTIEAGGRVGLVAADEVTFEYLRDRPFSPAGASWDQALADWRRLAHRPNAVHDATVTLVADPIEPQVTWGTNPSMVVPITGRVPHPDTYPTPALRRSAARALEYMGIQPGTRMRDVQVDTVFIGSCTNGRIEDLRAAAQVLRGRKVRDGVRALAVPGSSQVRRQAEVEGLDRIFRQAGFEWHEAGCSLCIGLNNDTLRAGERCASTSNRNYEGRQGPHSRTHLVSPPMAAAAAVAGRFVDVRDFAA